MKQCNRNRIASNLSVVAALCLTVVLGKATEVAAQAPLGFFTDVNNDLGPGLNSFDMDATPGVTPDGLMLLFHSHRAGHELYRATRLSTNEPFEDVVALGLAGDSGGPSVSFDALTLVFHAGGGGSNDLYQATRSNEDEPFNAGTVTSLGPAVNSTSWEILPHLSADGLMLLFTSDRPGGAGGWDIWVATRLTATEPFGTAVNLNDFFPGSQVNTNLDESGPSLSSDGLTLFFSATPTVVRGGIRPGVAGSSDIWVATRATLDEPFDTPVNLNDYWPGSEVNGPASDAWVSISRDWPAHGSKLYFTSNRSGSLGDYDIWQATWFVLPECGVDLVHVMDGVGTAFAAGAPDTFISPQAANVPLNRFTFQATEDVICLSAQSVYTGPVGRRCRACVPRAPGVATVTNDGGGVHTVEIDPPPAPGQWLKLRLNVTIADQECRSHAEIWLAHHPGDINQDGVVDIRDATAFGQEFRGRQAPELIDLNGDGVVDVSDATAFGKIWFGGDGAAAWQGSWLPDKPR